MLRIAVGLLLASIASTATAGGMNWPFRVAKVAGSQGNHTFTLVPVRPASEFPLNCETFTLTVRYDTWKWLLHAWLPWREGSGVNRKNHDEAINHLLRATGNSTVVYVGSMGGGFGAIKGPPLCSAESRGFGFMHDINKNLTAWSYFDWP